SYTSQWATEETSSSSAAPKSPATALLNTAPSLPGTTTLTIPPERSTGATRLKTSAGSSTCSSKPWHSTRSIVLDSTTSPKSEASPRSVERRVGKESGGAHG